MTEKARASFPRHPGLFRTLLALSLVGVACGGAPPPPPPSPAPLPPAPVAQPEPPRVTPDAPFRKDPPPPDGKVTFTPPKIASAKLKNGLKVFLVERHDLPIVAVRFVVSLGAGDVPDARPGLMSFTAALLDRGTKKRTALQFSDEFDTIGAQHSAWVDWDSAGTSLRVLVDQLDPALDLLADLTLAPTFPDAEIERVRTSRLTAIQTEKNSPPTIVQNALGAALFGRGHPYGHSLMGEEADVKAVTRADVVKTYDRLFALQNAALVVAGDVTQAAILPKLEARFGEWKAKPNPFTRRTPKAPAKADTDKRVVFVDKPGAAQSQVQVVRHGVSNGVKDRDKYMIANAVLGGSFSARINMNLREKNSYTYGARSHWNMRHGAGPFAVGGGIFTDKTGAAIKEIIAELDGLRKDGPTEEEMARAKESIQLAMPAKFETTAEVATAVADLFIHDLPLDDYEKRVARLEAVTAADVKRIATEYYGSESMTFVIVGAKAAVAPQLEGLNLGPLDERDPYGNPLRGDNAAATKPKK